MTDWAKKLFQSEAVTKRAPRKIGDVIQGQLMLIPSARQVDDAIRNIPHGQSLNVVELRNVLAKEHGTDVTCPVSIGYQLRTVAEAAREALDQGVHLEQVTPFWRVLDAKTPTTAKLGQAAVIVLEQRRKEGLAP